uniref:Non-haem dioxygenase N-terminal domain-containing protein n=1 Tax=Ananas comosus var. bracteatus TaxID=296719 RepID=A0A6V7QN64_ANACO|nr:unnamed protein product [Ananas comosus var. bracteatus]
MAPAESKLLLTDRAIPAPTMSLPTTLGHRRPPKPPRCRILHLRPPHRPSWIARPARSHVIKEIGSACRTDGFFMVKNHGIPEEAERLKCYSDDPSRTTRLSTSFNVRTEKVSNWRDFLRLHCYPLEDFIREWPCNPPDFKYASSGEYSKHARALAVRLLEGISESLGLEKRSHERTSPRDCKQQSERISVPTFYCPSPDALIEPAEALVDDDHPLGYRSFTYGEYYEKFWNRELYLLVASICSKRASDQH